MFLSFQPDPTGRIDGSEFFRRLCSTICIAKTRITLHFYDVGGRGLLREQDIENYIFNLIPDLPPLQNMHENFYPFYVFTATRRFMFFLDPKKSGKVSIRKLVSSQVMEELLELGMAGRGANGGGGQGGGNTQEAGGIAGNWFSAENSMRVYSQYLEVRRTRAKRACKGFLVVRVGDFR